MIRSESDLPEGPPLQPFEVTAFRLHHTHPLEPTEEVDGSIIVEWVSRPPGIEDCNNVSFELELEQAIAISAALTYHIDKLVNGCEDEEETPDGD